MLEHHLALKPGFQIENFRLESVLGKGGFGITYSARDLQLGKKVAVKELFPDSIATRMNDTTVVPQSQSLNDSWIWARDRFLDEARLLAGFSHPAIVGVHRLIEANGTIYMVMDYIEGESYEARLRQIGKIQEDEALIKTVAPILEGLNEVHQSGILHRDIKPENILINRQGQPVLIDFGSARSAIGATMTMTSIVTHGYSPIEQYQTRGRMGPWTDIYALGAVMCRAMTGEKPPVAADRLMDDDFQWVSNMELEGFSERLCNWVDWALRVRPEERPQSVSEWKKVLSHRMEARTPKSEYPAQQSHTHIYFTSSPEGTQPYGDTIESTEPPPLADTNLPAASFSKRIGAVLIDLSVAVAVAVAAAFIFGSIFMNEVSVVLSAMAAFLGFLARDSVFSGRSLGRLVFGLQVIRYSNGKPVSFIGGFARNGMPFASLAWSLAITGALSERGGPEIGAIAGVLFMIATISLFATFGKGERRTLLDKLMKTMVVDIRRK
jgi:serine/threonine protein kinase